MKRIYFVFIKCGLVRLVAANLLIVYYTTHLKIAICRATGFTGQAIIRFSDLAEKEGNRRSCRDVVVTRVYTLCNEDKRFCTKVSLPAHVTCMSEGQRDAL